MVHFQDVEKKLKPLQGQGSETCLPTQETRTRFQVERHSGRASSAWTQCANHKGLSLSVYLRFMMKAPAWRNVEFGIECKSKSLRRRKKSKGAR